MFLHFTKVKCPSTLHKFSKIKDSSKIGFAVTKIVSEIKGSSSNNENAEIIVDVRLIIQATFKCGSKR